ncbi:CBO0543 family protein [Bacillus sp. MRMR6]|uniref:CBO0543 family protein n=1 Tax=Bacillus sp. MRMR6 TaxID=1928617 RepID=UPI000950E868|nr:CBO0543 family protein [Bacillus sp. MRMR6]OLS40637.1 hypothetical protein BTR25_09055 [Bacillus sp. MRMR6]
MERRILSGLLAIGLGLLPVVFKRDRLKDWIIIYLLKGFMSSFLDSIVTRQKKVTYPVRFLPEYFRINVLFDYLLFPLTCVVYNRMTYHSNTAGIFLKAFLFSIPMTVTEVIFERSTKLIKFRNGWSWHHTLLSETAIFIFIRIFIGAVRKSLKKYTYEN